MHHNYHMDPPEWIQGKEEIIFTAVIESRKYMNPNHFMNRNSRL